MYSMSTIRLSCCQSLKLDMAILYSFFTQKINLKNVYLDMNHHSSILAKIIIENSIYFLFLQQI